MEKELAEAWVVASLRQRGYILKQLIGTGAFGSVYLVKNLQTGQSLACKVAVTCQAVKILKKEGELLRQITHPLFAAYEKWGQEPQGAFLLMEYVEGESLAQRLVQGALPQKQAVDYAIQLAEGIRYLHELSTPILYRDLKPEHIKVGQEGRIKLLDLGCSCKLADAHLAKAGTKGYAPPEQLLHGQPGLYSDVYALGKLLQYMLTGRNPCVASVHKSGLRTYRKTFSPYLQELVARCTEEDYRERIQDMKCVLWNLRKYGREEGYIYENIVQ